MRSSNRELYVIVLVEVRAGKVQQVVFLKYTS